MKNENTDVLHKPDTEPDKNAQADEKGKGRLSGILGGPHARRNRIAVASGACAVALVAGLGIAWAQGSVQSPPPAADAAPAVEQKEDEKVVPVNDVASKDVAAKCADLVFDGEPVGIDAEVLAVEFKDGRLMVVETSEGDPHAMVESAAKRGAALAASLKDARIDGAEVKDVTWVVTDKDGNRQVAATFVPKDAPEKGSVADVVNGSAGHVISDDCFAGLGDDKQGIEQTGGEAPKAPDGDELIALPAKPEEASGSNENKDAGEQGATEQQNPADGNASGSSNANNSGSTAPSGNNNGGGSGTAAPSNNGAASSNSGSGNASSGSTNNNGGGGTSIQKPAEPQKKWVPEQGHYEPIYENVWVPNVQYVTHERWECSACGGMFGSKGEMSNHVHSTYGDAQHPNGASAIDQSYDEKVDKGSYQQKQTGQKWVVDVPGHWE